MNLREQVELLALVSAHSPLLIESGRTPPREALQRYWGATRAQNRLWLSRLVDFPARSSAADEARREGAWDALLPVVADVLAGDLSIRVWGAILAATDSTSGQVCGDPIARSVLLQQEVVRQRALELLLALPAGSGEQVAALDRLRRQLERWTDVLTGHLVRRYGLAEFAVNADRSRDFGEEQLRDSWGVRSLQVWDLYLVCLRTALPDVPLPEGRLADLRVEVAQAILSCFPADAFLDCGPLKSVRLRRLLDGVCPDRRAPHMRRGQRQCPASADPQPRSPGR